MLRTIPVTITPSAASMSSGRPVSLCGSASSGATRGRKQTLPLFAILAILWLPAIFFTRGWENSLLIAAGGVGFAGLLYKATASMLPGLLSTRILILVYGLQIIALFFVSLLQAVSVEYSSLLSQILDSNFRMTWALLIVPVGVVIGSVAMRSLYGKHIGLKRTLQGAPHHVQSYITVCLFVIILHWFAVPEVTGTAGYIVRVISSCVEFVPLAAGWFSWISRRFHIMSLSLLAANAVIGILMGTRQGIVILVGYYVCRILAGPSHRKVRSLLFVSPLMIAGFYLFSLLGVIRAQTGRDSLELLTPQNISHFADTLVASTQGSDNHDDSRMTSAGWGRLFNWPNAAVVLQTPESIPYRGFEGLGAEVTGYMRINGDSVESRETFLDAGLGTGRARDYGFVVNRATSVEFSVLADGWSRAGVWCALLFGGVLSVALGTLERLTAGTRLIDANGKLLLGCVYAKVAIFAGTIPLLDCLRMLAITSGIVFVISAITLHLTSRRRRQHASLSH